MSNHHLAVSFILTEADNDQLVSLVEAIKLRRETLARKNRFAFRVGAAVKFEHRGVEYKGIVQNVKVKKASVACTSPFAITYNVPLSMLEAA